MAKSKEFLKAKRQHEELEILITEARKIGIDVEEFFRGIIRKAKQGNASLS